MASVVKHGAFTIKLEDNGDVEIAIGDNPVAFFDGHYAREKEEKFQVLHVYTQGEDEVALSLSLGNDKVKIRDVNPRLVDKE